MKNFVKTRANTFYAITLIAFSLGVFVIAVRMNLFRYNNFDFGKFDLGNMIQMLWYTAHGKFMYLTDYFGGNVPRWSMSHVDPILVLFLPLYLLFPHPLTIVFAQIFLVTVVASFLIYKIAVLNFKSHTAAFFVALAYLFYPALGYLNAVTGFHGVSAAIPFMLLCFYALEKMHHNQKFSKKYLVLFWVSAIITISGKEQLAIYTALLAVFIFFFRIPKPQDIAFLSKKWLKTLFSHPLAPHTAILFCVSVIWFYLAFFVIIPNNAKHRIESYTNFTKELRIDTDLTKDVIMENYFLARYEGFGDSYTGVIIGMLTNPEELVRILFSGDKLDNFNKTFTPVSFLPFAAPQILIIAIPDLIINYATTAGGIGTSEITNHRISMIIPIVFLALIFAILTISRVTSVMFEKLVKKQVPENIVVIILSALVLGSSIYTTFSFNNPIYLWATQAIEKRFSIKVQAKTNMELASKPGIQIGDRFRLSGIENKDRECANKVVENIPNNVSISGPDYLGAHLAQRKTYAIFPALYSEADYVIVDVFSQKIMRILDSDVSLVRDVVGEMVADDTYENVLSCGNLFVFKRSPNESSYHKLPLQERYDYEKNQNLEIFQGLFLADYKVPEVFTKGVEEKVQFVYIKTQEGIDDYVVFTSLINETTGEIYQVANLPSYGVNQIKDWTRGRYYIEDMTISLPKDLEEGTYRIFLGMSNNIRTRSIFLGKALVQ